jgi:hypothetical protein
MGIRVHDGENHSLALTDFGNRKSANEDDMNLEKHQKSAIRCKRGTGRKREREQFPLEGLEIVGFCVGISVILPSI